ncbi:MAG TPA: hypothetical protein VHF25_08850 [Nitriliruptorales bacterium]|nr:hypothetical protein [Nitriliruptorales bacterium]
MNRPSVGRQVTAVLLPFLSELRGGTGHGLRSGGWRGGVQRRRARQMWQQLEPDVAARPDLAAAIDEAVHAPGAATRKGLIQELDAVLEDDPLLSSRIEQRLERVVRWQTTRDQLGAMWALAVLGIAALVAPALAYDRELGLIVVAGLALTVTGLVLYRRLRAFAWLVNWVLLFLVIGAAAVVTQTTDEWQDAENAKVFAIIVLSLLPGWLYLQFIAVRGRSLWEDYVTNLFRLHVDDHRNLPEPPRGTVEHRLWREAGGARMVDPGALYRRKFEAAYGKVVAGAYSGEGAARFRGEGFAPVVFTTLLTAFGWTAVLAPAYEGAWVFGSGVQGYDAPLWEALSFGFVGAYWFILQSVARRYFQDDLRTNAYISAVVRIIIVALLVAVVYQVWGLIDGAGALSERGWLNGVAFGIGVFPSLGLQILQKTLTKVVGPMTDLRNQFPLTHLDGLNMWYESRLVEEGIEDLQNLATAELVDVLLSTRVPVGRVVDWIDQAHLYLRVTDRDQREALRRLGIRTATDLQDAFADPATATPTAAAWPARAEQVRRVVYEDATDAVHAVDILLASLAGEANLRHARDWREFHQRATSHPPALDDGEPAIRSGDLSTSATDTDRPTITLG